MSSVSLGKLYHSAANFAAAKLMKLLFGYSARLHVLRGDKTRMVGGVLLASNHISHFDPFVISSVVRRKIDWMAMEEFFPNPILGFLLHAVDAFPAARDRADSKTIRTALERLKQNRIVGIFPEGGIRDGARSLLEGAPLRAGAAALAQMAHVPIVPCVIVGTDRLYAARKWLPFRRVPVWIAFGEPISASADLSKHAARQTMDAQLSAAFKNLYVEIKTTFALTADDLPHPPRERMRDSRPALPATPKRSEGGSARPNENAAENCRASAKCQSSSDLADIEHGNRSGCPTSLPVPNRRPFKSSVLDSVMCASMNILQSRHRLHEGSREEMERYVRHCQGMSVHEYYALPRNGDSAHAIDDHRVRTIIWPSPIKTKFAANDISRVDLFPCSRGWQAPTVLMLHALMSASQIGYRRWATHFNKLGWNACFVHLPYHYSRVPAGYWNGELAITADLIRNAEALRQGVIELRQLLAALRQAGSSEFAVIGTSYGGWIGALLAMVERDFRFLALMAPIVNVEHAIWENPACKSMRRELRKAKIEPELVARHYHLSSPLHGQSLCDPARILFVSGDFDIIARPNDLERIHEKWRGSELLRVSQGHFGYRMFRNTVDHLQTRGWWNS